jgi:hypothetical protein
MECGDKCGCGKKPQQESEEIKKYFMELNNIKKQKK